MAFPRPWKRGHPAGVHAPRLPGHCGPVTRAPGKAIDPNPGSARKRAALRLPSIGRSGAA